MYDAQLTCVLCLFFLAIIRGEACAQALHAINCTGLPRDFSGTQWCRVIRLIVLVSAMHHSRKVPNRSDVN